MRRGVDGDNSGRSSCGFQQLDIAGAAGSTPPTLYVHAIYAADPEAVRADLRDMEDHVLTMVRGRGWARGGSTR